ncbi:AraC family transcriptional regulator [Paenibacillus sp. FSL R7-0273]|uniref:AraC family transcriptional regulator n=1 Tax=Paenibacillus sp. FSL R7-0273 TaxID=1536772 RepID=UPI0004F77901|nr:AraC family transcriptional regulator [Paenibacillus sp. FSL R7-0273]AIQ45833.1 AraC family transcriptional regulator [Paenibacillus sp. FSL R7-0273]OMF95362.1 AraC family transcriptional regulator [Paenibacillus sp. FSL R7-0273]
MTVRRSRFIMSGEEFFGPGIPVYVNRAYENFELHEHSHAFVEITYVSEGSGVHYIDDEAIPVEHGTLFFIPVGRSHVFRPRTTKKDRPLIVYNCLFPLTYMEGLRGAYPQAADICDYFTVEHIPWFSVKDTTGSYHMLFQELYSEFSARPPGYLAVIAALIVRMLTGLYRQQLQSGTSAGARPQWTAVDEAIACIKANYAGGVTLGGLAAAANLSERQFSRLFRQQTGMSFTGYLHNIRMDAACRLLTDPGYSVAGVAAAVGYADLKFFHQLFKRKIGMAPRQYRLSVRADQG